MYRALEADNQNPYEFIGLSKMMIKIPMNLYIQRCFFRVFQGGGYFERSWPSRVFVGPSWPSTLFSYFQRLRHTILIFQVSEAHYFDIFSL